jgi:hypothetical protein
MDGLLSNDESAGLFDFNPLDALVSQYGLRAPYQGEIDFFKKRPEVAGMAAEDQKIVLNPFSKNSQQEQMSVARNEALRLFMQLNNLSPSFEMTERQRSVFKNTEYGKNPEAAKQTIIARYLTGDPSAADVTKEQKEFAEKLLQMFK